MHSAWRHWLQFVENERVASLQASLRTEHGRLIEAKQRRGAEVIRRWRLQSLLPAFERWRDYVRERRVHKHDTMRRVLMRLQHSRLWLYVMRYGLVFVFL